MIVDRSLETREVLRTALERKGACIYETDRAEEGVEMTRRLHPDVIVLDMEIDSSGRRDLADGVVLAAKANCTPLVVLQGDRRRAGGLEHGELVYKPYHYGPLVRKIEEMLGASR